MPISTQERAHRSTRADANEPFIVLVFQHGRSLALGADIPVQGPYSVVIFARARAINGFGVA
jgi:hypothetical protein